MNYEQWQLQVDDLGDEIASLRRKRRTERCGLCYTFAALLNAGTMAALSGLPGLGELGWVAVTSVIMTIILSATFVDCGPRAYTKQIETLRLTQDKLRRRMPTDLLPEELL